MKAAYLLCTSLTLAALVASASIVGIKSLAPELASIQDEAAVSAFQRRGLSWCCKQSLYTSPTSSKPASQKKTKRKSQGKVPAVEQGTVIKDISASDELHDGPQYLPGTQIRAQSRRDGGRWSKQELQAQADALHSWSTLADSDGRSRNSPATKSTSRLEKRPTAFDLDEEETKRKLAIQAVEIADIVENEHGQRFIAGTSI